MTSLFDHKTLCRRAWGTGGRVAGFLAAFAAGLVGAEAPGVLGDLDGDGSHTVRDVVKIVNHLQAIEFLPGDRQAFADVNEDGFLNRADVDFLIEVILENATLEAVPKTIPLELSPGNGEGNVALTREAVVRFSLPLADSVTLTPEDFYAEFSGQRVLSRVELSSDRLKATLFFLENLPASARVRVRLKGEGLTDSLGRALDLDRNGTAGGDLVFDFDTVSISPVPRTGVVGRVIATEKQADGSERPLAGVIIEVAGAEESLRTTTGADGSFALSPVPAGDFFVNIDGRPLTGTYPEGAYYPYLGKVWKARAGRLDNPAGGTGIIYLPRVRAGSLQATSLSEPTTVALPAETLAVNPEMAGTQIVVPANGLFSNDGTRGGRVGMAPVPPDRLPEPLPAGFDTPLVVTIQTDGPTNFDQPVPVKFPNLPNPVTGDTPPPGAAVTLWSFDHDVGRWEVAGPMTVSADGLFLESDPGTGVRQPGWHFPAPPAVQGGGGGPAPVSPRIPGGPRTDGGPDEGGIDGPGGPGSGPGDGGPDEGGPDDGGGPLLGGPGSDYGPGREGCTFSHIIDAGMLIPGVVEALGPPTATEGRSLSFRTDGATDTGGREGINCPDGGSDEVDIPPGPVSYRWMVTVNGVTVATGTGRSASVSGEITKSPSSPMVGRGPGTYEATFYALSERYALRGDEIEIGSASVEVVPTEDWETESITVSVDAILPNPLVTTLKRAISAIPGVNIELDTEETEVTVESGVRACREVDSGAFIPEGEEFLKGAVTIKGAVEAPLWPGAGFAFDANLSLGFADVVVDANVGLTIELGAVVSASVGKRLDECRGEDCFFGNAGPSITVEFEGGFSFEGYVNLLGYLIKIEPTNITGLKAVTSIGGSVVFNGEDNCYKGLHGNIKIGPVDVIILNVKIPVPGSYIKLPGWKIPIYDGLSWDIGAGSDPLGGVP